MTSFDVQLHVEDFADVMDFVDARIAADDERRNNMINVAWEWADNRHVNIKALYAGESYDKHGLQKELKAILVKAIFGGDSDADVIMEALHYFA
jgi:hypothetical protein